MMSKREPTCLVEDESAKCYEYDPVAVNSITAAQFADTNGRVANWNTMRKVRKTDQGGLTSQGA